MESNPERLLEQIDLRQGLEKALLRLTPREERVIRLRFGLADSTPGSLREVGETMGITAERIRQIEMKAIRKLRHPARIRFLLSKRQYAVLLEKRRQEADKRKGITVVPCETGRNSLVFEMRMQAIPENQPRVSPWS